MKGKSVAIGLTKPADAEPKSLPYKNSQEKKNEPQETDKQGNRQHSHLHLGSP